MKNIILMIIILIIILTGCKKYSNTTDKLEETAKIIVEAFDKRDKKLLKSILHDSVIIDDSILDDEIDKAFNFYQGNSVSWNIYGTQGNDITKGKVVTKNHPQIWLKTDKDNYIIHFSYITKDDTNPKGEGVYSISIVQRDLFTSYYGESYGDEMKTLEKEFPFYDYAPHGYNYIGWPIGVFQYDEEELRKAYFDKNKKEVILYEVDKEGNLIKDKNGKLIVKDKKTDSKND